MNMSLFINTLRLKRFVLLLGAFFVMQGNLAHAAEPLTQFSKDEIISPQQIYLLAQERNGRAMEAVRSKIDIADENGNTALCLAQQNKDKESYKMLLVFGASKDVECHDDTDPICALIVGEKLKVSGAGWLLGAAAAGGAIYGITELLNDDDSCSKGYSKHYPNVAACGKMGAAGWIFEQDPKRRKCGKCTPKTYDTGCTTLWQSVNDCGEHTEGWNFESSGYSGDEICGICTPKACPILAETPTSVGSNVFYHTTGHCPERQYMVAENVVGVAWQGERECFRCDYKCDEKNGYAALNSCQVNSLGSVAYDCERDAATQCYYRKGPAQCPVEDSPKVLGSNPRYTTLEYCPGRKNMIAEFVTQNGWSGELGCFSCHYKCDESNGGYEDEASCTNNEAGIETYSCVRDEKTGCYSRTGTASCPIVNTATQQGSNPGYKELVNCPIRRYMKAVSTTPSGWSGETECYTCNYSCDEKNGGYTNATICETNESGGAGYICQQDPVTQCYYRSKTQTPENPDGGEKECPTDYSTAYQSDSNCVIIGGTKEGWSWSQNGWSGELKCGKCDPKACTAGSTAYQSDANCPVIAYKKAYGRELKGWSGTEGCYECLYQCDSAQNAYENDSVCQMLGMNCTKDDVSGCYIVSDGCPEGSSLTIRDASQCGTSGSKGWRIEKVADSTIPGMACNKCVAKVCPTGSSTDSEHVCDAKQHPDGWEITPTDNYQGIAGGTDLQCFSCTAKSTCSVSGTEPKNGCGDSNSRRSVFWEDWTPNENSHIGDDECGTCQKKCNSGNNDEVYDTESACQAAAVTGGGDVGGICVRQGDANDPDCYRVTPYQCMGNLVIAADATEEEKIAKCAGDDWFDLENRGLTDYANGNYIQVEQSYFAAGYETKDTMNGEICITCKFKCSDALENELLTKNSTDCDDKKGWTPSGGTFIPYAGCYWCKAKSCEIGYSTNLSINQCKINNKGGTDTSWKVVQNNDMMSGGLPCELCAAVPCAAQGENIGATDCTSESDEITGLIEDTEIEGLLSGATQCHKCKCAHPEWTADTDCEDGGKARLSVNSYGVKGCYYCPDRRTRMLSAAWEKVNNQTLIIRHEEGDYYGNTTINAKATAPITDELTSEVTGGNAVGSITLYNSAANAEVALQYNSRQTLYNAQANGEGSEAQVSAEGSLNLIMEKGAENVTAFGMSSGTDAYNAYATNNARATGLIDIKDTEAATNVIYGIQARRNAYNAYATGEDAFASGRININTATDIAAYGMYAGDDIYNANTPNQTSIVNLTGSGAGNLYGLYSEAGSVYNSGEVNVHAANGNAYGIYVDNGAGQIVDNSGNIIVASDTKTAYGIYVANGGDEGNGITINNSGLIDATGDANSRGIKVAANGANATVSNTGRIIVNGSLNNADTAIDLGGGTLANSGEVEFKGRQNLNALNGRVAVEKGGSYKADALSGDIHIGQSVVKDGFQDRYTTENAVQAQNDGLNVISDSAMFKGSLASNNKGGYDAVADRRNFNEFAPNESIAEYLEENYKQQRLAELYAELKSAETDELLSKNILSETGADVLINLPQENIYALRHASETIAESVLTPTDDVNRITSGADAYFMDADGRRGASGYETNATTAFMYGDKRLNNKNRLGLGLAFMQLNTSYDNGGDHDESFISLFVPWLHNFTDKLRLASILSFGWGYGDYDRGANRDAHVNDFIYGLTNKLVYSINLADFAELEPALVLNAIGYYQDEMDEGDLVVKGGNHLSLEAGVGAYLKKELMSGKYGKLTARLGGMYYHELADPYHKIRAGFKSGVGTYSINDFADIYNRDRAVLSAMLDYEYKRIALYLRYHQLLQRNKAQNVDAGIRYNF